MINIDGFFHTTPAAWPEIYARLDEWNNYHRGVCARCGENIRLQGEALCMECLEERNEREDKELVREMSIYG